ncbi:Glucan endo-1,3-beta-glucosidase, basic vacuolar isoform [Linum perenne]
MAILYSTSYYASSIAATCLLLGVLFANLQTTVAQTGVCYGMMGNNLPPPSEVISLCQQNNIRRMRLYDPNRDALWALRDSGIEVTIGVPNSDLKHLNNWDDAYWWVQEYVRNNWPNVKVKYIAVGNEVSPMYNADLASAVLPAMKNIYNALVQMGLHEQVKVSTAIDMTLLANSYPPSAGAFRDDIRWFLDPIIGFLGSTKSPLLANIYTYFSYRDNPSTISLPYALLSSQSVSVWDNGLAYTNLFDAMLDSLYSAIERLGGWSVDVVVSESGWPSGGAGAATTLDNARVFYTNLVQQVKRGSPKRPNKAIETYLFGMFDENQKDPELERNFGVFYPNKQNKYNLYFGGGRNIPSITSTWDVSSTELRNATDSVSAM